MKKSILLAFILVSAFSVYIGMEVQRRRSVPGAQAGQSGFQNSGVLGGAGSRSTTANQGTGGPGPGGVGPSASGGASGTVGASGLAGKGSSSEVGGSGEQGRASGSLGVGGSGAASGPGGSAGTSGSTRIGNTGETGGSGGQGRPGGPPGVGGSKEGGSSGLSPRGQRGAVSVEVVPIQVGTIREVGNFSGTLEARSQFVLSTKIAGRLKSIFVDAGDEVKKGELVALLEEEDYRYPYEQAVADLEAARANLEDALGALETAKREYERAKSLFESKIVSAAELDSSQNQYRKAEATVKVVQAQVRQREAALAIAKDRLDSTRILATWESEEPVRVIGERFVNPGTLLRANDPICSVLDISSLIGVVNVTEQGYTRIRPGQRATLRVEILPGKEFLGTVDRVAPFLNPSTRQATVRINVPNRGRELKPGMFIQVEVEFSRKQQTQIIPEACLVTREDRIGVFLVNPQEGKARFIPVQVGIREGGNVEVLAPRLTGSVVITGQHLLQNGSAVLVAGRGRP